ncbi:hypothetical protein IG631_00838 [Alternaria alternata]|nr:hypothetical protein IG631_00838 [Alternaria alternata]
MPWRGMPSASDAAGTPDHFGSNERIDSCSDQLHAIIGLTSKVALWKRWPWRPKDTTLCLQRATSPNLPKRIRHDVTAGHQSISTALTLVLRITIVSFWLRYAC